MSGFLLNPYRFAAPAVPPITYILDEDFESAPIGWTADDGGGGVADLEYTVLPLAGAQSALLSRVASDAFAWKSLGASYPRMRLKCLFEVRAFPSANTSNRRFGGLDHAGGTILCQFAIGTNNSGSTFNIKAQAFGTGGPATVAEFAKGQAVYLFMDIDSNLNTVDVWWNDVDSIPSDPNKHSSISGVGFAAPGRCTLRCDYVNAEYIYDNVQVWDPTA